VQLFVAISGFIVTIPFVRHFLLGERKPSLRAFYVKRITRIEPPYVIALVLFGVGVFMTARENFRIEDFLAGAVYLRTALLAKPRGHCSFLGVLKSKCSFMYLHRFSLRSLRFAHMLYGA